jgi:hypothetical protein
VDGGPKTVYEGYLKALLQTIRDRGGALDVAMLSHVDGDHIGGLLDLMNDLQWQRVREIPETVPIGEVWHNSFSQTLGADVQERFYRFLDRSGPVRSTLARSDRTRRDIAQGDELTQLADTLGLLVNPDHRFGPHRVITVEQATQPIVLGDLALHVVGPTEGNLQELKEEWIGWLGQQEDRVLVPDPREAKRAARRLDTSVPNLSSIMFLAKAAGKTILLTGDGRGDHLRDGLRGAGLLDGAGRLHVNVLKLPHHGSQYNLSQGFLRSITADRYIISANGRHGHPHRATLRWIVEAARDQGRTIELVATNWTRSLRELVREHVPREYGYRLTVMPEEHSELILELAP